MDSFFVYVFRMFGRKRRRVAMSLYIDGLPGLQKIRRSTRYLLLSATRSLRSMKLRSLSCLRLCPRDGGEFELLGGTTRRSHDSGDAIDSDKFIHHIQGRT